MRETKFTYLPTCGGAQAELSFQHNSSTLQNPLGAEAETEAGL